MDLILSQIWNGSTFQVSVARPYPNHTWVAPPPVAGQAVLDNLGHLIDQNNVLQFLINNCLPIRF